MFKLFFLCFLFISTPMLHAQEKLKVAHMLYSSLDASPTDIKTTLSLWMSELSQAMGIELESKFYTSMEDLKEGMQTGEVNYMIIRSIDLVKYFDQDELIPGFAPQRKSDEDNKLLLVTSKKNKSLRIGDFKDTKVGLCKSEHVGKMYLDSLLIKNNLPRHEDHFSRALEYKKCSKVVLDIFFKKIDIAVVRKGTLDLVNEINPQVGRSIAIIDSKELRNGIVGFFAKGTDKNLIRKFFAGMDVINNSTRAKQILTLFKADHLKKTNSKDLKELEDFYVEYLKLTKKSLN